MSSISLKKKTGKVNTAIKNGAYRMDLSSQRPMVIRFVLPILKLVAGEISFSKNWGTLSASQI